MLIAVDAMGGDYGASEVCPGVVDACTEHADLEVALVGVPSVIEPFIAKSEKTVFDRIHIVPAEETIGMDEQPTKAIRTKRRSSLRVAMEMVHSGEAQGCVSAGNTGAILAGGVLVVGRISGIDRPGLGIVLPTLKPTFLLDAGATVRCKPLNLCQFAIMGSIYMKDFMNIDSPRVCLLSNGSEEIKGDDVIVASREILSQNNRLNFGGYIEPNQVTMGEADVVVCDGFTGNIMLKSFEGIVEYGKTMMKESIGHNIIAKIGIAFLYPTLKKIGNRVDYQHYGGSALLGVNGAVIKAHGRSRAAAITSALGVACNFVRQNALEKIKTEIGKNTLSVS